MEKFLVISYQRLPGYVESTIKVLINHDERIECIHTSYVTSSAAAKRSANSSIDDLTRDKIKL